MKKALLILLLLSSYYADAQILGGKRRGARAGGGTMVEMDPTIPSFVKELQESEVNGFKAAAVTSHSHSNKAVLDFISAADTANWQSAVLLMHQHENKDLLDAIDATIFNQWSAAASSAHVHANRTVIDGITSTLVSNWNNAYTATHSHANKAVIDAITQTLIDNWNASYTALHTHSNKSVIDGITAPLVGNWNTAFTNSHTHANKSTIDGIAASDITAWNGAATNSHAHSNKSMLDAITVAPAPNVLAGYTSAAGTVAATDNVLQAIQKLNGNDGLKAPLASPAFTGTPTVPTATAGANTTQAASTAFVTGALGSYLTTANAASTYLSQSNATATYLTQSNAAGTYQILGNLSTDLTASPSKYPSVNAVIAGLSGKQNAFAGTTGQYVRGDGSLAAFPTIPSNTDYMDLTTAQSAAGIKTFTAAALFSSGFTFAGDLIPTTNASFNIGSPTIRVNNMYVGNIVSGGNLTFRGGSTSNSLSFGVGASGNNAFGTISGANQVFYVQSPGAAPTAVAGYQAQIYGNMLWPTTGQGPVLTASDGSRWRIVVSPGGAVSATTAP